MCIPRIVTYQNEKLLTPRRYDNVNNYIIHTWYDMYM